MRVLGLNTSLGLSLLEAMHLGMPVVALGTTEAHRAVPPGTGTGTGTGTVSTHLPDLYDALRRCQRDPRLARDTGDAARQAALDRYGLKAFLGARDHLLQEAAS